MRDHFPDRYMVSQGSCNREYFVKTDRRLAWGGGDQPPTPHQFLISLAFNVEKHDSFRPTEEIILIIPPPLISTPKLRVKISPYLVQGSPRLLIQVATI